MTPKLSLRAALDDPALLGSVLAGESWAAWRVMLIASVGEPLTPDELEIFRHFTGRTTSPAAMVDEAAFVIGRRGGKDRAASVLAAYLGGLCDYSTVLARGEQGTLLCLGADQRQASIQLNYIEGAFAASPMLRQLIQNRTADTLELRNGISIEVRAASFRRVRGPTAIAVIATEVAFWNSDDSVNPDVEILNAVRPTLATTGGPLIMISSPYSKRGELWTTYKKHFRPDGDPLILVAQGASRQFNPTLPERVVSRAMERDRAAATAEYLGEFRNDIESFISTEIIEACVERGVYERAPLPGIVYHGFVDPSGGSADSMTLAIGHRSEDVAVLDCVREIKPPFSPSAAVDEFAALLKTYRLSAVTGDRYGGEFPRELFRKSGIEYRVADKTRSDLYRDLLPAVNSRRVDLLDHDRLLAQLVGLERRTARAGKDSIDHAPGAHDDIANAVAGAVNCCLASVAEPFEWYINGAVITQDGDKTERKPIEDWLCDHPAAQFEKWGTA